MFRTQKILSKARSQRLKKWIDSLIVFQKIVGQILSPGAKSFSLKSDIRVPSVDIVEKDGNIVVRAEIPGVDKKDIEITLNSNNLTIQGKSKHESKETTDQYHRCEISTGSFSRTLTLPSDVDGDNVKATFTDGLLEVTLPKIEKTSQSKITID